MRLGTKLALTALGLAVVGGGVAHAFAMARARPMPPADRGFKLLPNCAGIEVTNEATALKWAQKRATSSAYGAPSTIEPYQLHVPGIADVLGECVKTMTPEQYAKAFAGSHRFLYNLMVNLLDGQVKANRRSAQQARDALQAYRDMLVAANIDVSALKPLPEALFIQPSPAFPMKPGYTSLFDLPAGYKASALLQVPANELAPLVVVLHGREGTEKQLQKYVPDDLGAHVVFLRGPILSKPGFLFFKPRLADKEDVLVPAMRKSLDDLFEVIETLKMKYPTSRVVVLGGSQGGALAYLLAAAGLVDGAVAISGSLPKALWPTGASNVGVVGIHGTKDPAVPFAAGQATLEAFKAAGYPFTGWVPLAGVTHAVKQVQPSHDALRKLLGKGMA